MRQEHEHAALEAFATAMRIYLDRNREADLFQGWESAAHVTGELISDALREHVERGDPIAVGLFCLYLAHRGERIVADSRRPFSDPERQPEPVHKQRAGPKWFDPRDANPALAAAWKAMEGQRRSSGLEYGLAVLTTTGVEFEGAASIDGHALRIEQSDGAFVPKLQSVFVLAGAIVSARVVRL